ncbi:MAG: cytochrome c [Rhodospirillales bacterium]|tara:strand:+ start:12585 stop:13016 length:432 start_codon:yes stop_codon:yes gene_type:complete
MKIFDNLPAVLVTTVLVGGLGVVVWKAVSSNDDKVTVSVKVPALSVFAESGKKAFDVNCAQCHGVNASGTDKGPPLIHDIYNPGHHADGAFVLAARRGVRQHHWPYGNMPPQPQVTDEEIKSIIRYVRELQAANGIQYKPHRM